MATVTTLKSANHNPLDILVMVQIGALRKYEEDLEREMVEPGASEKIGAKIHSLRIRAERLNRMIDAMAVGGTFAESAMVPQVA